MAEDVQNNLWYKLMTISDDVQKRCHLWDGYQRVLLEETGFFDPGDDTMQKLPVLSPEDITAIENHLGGTLPQLAGLKLPPGYPRLAWMINFSDITFPDFVDFNFLYFGFYADFKKARFGSSANFNGARFGKSANFNGAIFKDVAYFNGARFGSNAYFNKATFEGVASFEEAKFKKDVQFIAHEDITSASFSFKRTNFEYLPPAFFGRKMHQDTDWTDAIFPLNKDLSEPNKLDKDLSEPNKLDKDLSEPSKLDKGLLEPDKLGKGLSESDRLAESIRLYECLAQGARDTNKTDDEHMFFRHEMHCKTVIEKNPFIRAFYRFYGLCSDYGFSITRPLRGLCVLSVVCFVLVLFVFVWLEETADLCTMFGYSMRNAVENGLPFLRFSTVFENSNRIIPPLSIWSGIIIKIISAVQFILSSIFIYLLVLGLRNRFRMR